MFNEMRPSIILIGFNNRTRCQHSFNNNRFDIFHGVQRNPYSVFQYNGLVHEENMRYYCSITITLVPSDVSEKSSFVTFNVLTTSFSTPISLRKTETSSSPSFVFP